MTENPSEKTRWTAAEMASAAEPLDGADLATLTALRDLYERLDPVPEGLVDRLRFAVALDEVMTEVAAITRVPLAETAVRSDAAVTRTHTVTFSAESLTAMVTISRGDHGLRVDGWLTPAREVTVRLRAAAGEREVRSEPTGRFVFDGVPEGFVQLVFEGDGTTVVTPAFEL